MAYQNVGRPRFFIDNYIYLRALGLEPESYINKTEEQNNLNNREFITVLNNESTFTLSPERSNKFESFTDQGQPSSALRFFIPCEQNISDMDFSGNMKWYGAILNHNLGNQNLRIQNIMYAGSVNYEGLPYAEFDNFSFENGNLQAVLNAGMSATDIQNGSSIWFSDLNPSPPEEFPVRFTGFRLTGDNIGGTSNVQIGAVSMGVMYTMPHSPDLNLSMEIEFDGYDELETSGGSTLTNIRHTSAPCWLNDGKYNSPFSVGEFSDDKMLSGAKRNGRRNWSLKFSLISDTDVFSSNYMNTMHMEDTADYNDSDKNTEGDSFEYNIFTDDSFIAQVWNKTLGGALPFIFQPDSNNDNPDQFCIAKFDQDTLKVSQTAFRTYSFSVKIREVW